LVEQVLAQHDPSLGRDAEEVLEADRWATALASKIAG